MGSPLVFRALAGRRRSGGLAATSSVDASSKGDVS
jgi:hypothetical protein